MEQKICMYCGKPIEKTKHVLRAGKNEEYTVYCCGAQCYQNMKQYIKNAEKKKYLLYITAAVFVLMNLVIFGLKMSFRFMYLPMMGLGVILMISPSIYVTSWFFEKYGVKKTVKGVRAVGTMIVLLGILFTVFWKP